MATATASPASSPFTIEASNSGGGSNEIPSEGNHPAVLVGLIDLGTHTEEYQGKESDNRKVLFCWELPGEMKADGTPHVVTADYNMPATVGGKSKLRSMIEGWRGRPMEDKERLDCGRMVGASCLINIGHGKSQKGNTYAKIMSITPMPKGMQPPKPWNAPFIWSFDSGRFDPPTWLPYLYGRPVEDVIAESREGRQAAHAASTSDDQIPF